MIQTGLVIGGSDNTGGAGIQADIKTFTLFGVNAMTAVTSVTAQDSSGVISSHHVPSSLLKDQIYGVLDHYSISVVKTGMLGSLENTQIVGEALEQIAPKGIPLIIDPVIISTSGKSLIEKKAIQVLIEKIISIGTLATPNITETILLSEYMGIGNKKSILKVFEKPLENEEFLFKLKKALNTSLLLKGGDLEKPIIRDILIHEDKIKIYEKESIKAKATHGTGCTFASAIAAKLALNDTLWSAIEKAQDFISGAIANPIWKEHEYGPVNQLWMENG